MSRKTTKHEAFGLVRFSRITGAKRLFQSSVESTSFMRLTISRADKDHENGRDWVHGRGEIIEIDMTPAQFAELLTSMNTSGVPCTINHVEGKRPPELKEEDEPKEGVEIIKKMREMGKQLAAPFNELNKIIDGLAEKKTISQKAASELKGTFYRAKQDLESNLPYYMEQLDESAEKVIHQKKVELDAALTHFKVQLGDQKLEELKQLAIVQKKGK